MLKCSEAHVAACPHVEPLRVPDSLALLINSGRADYLPDKTRDNKPPE